MRSSLASKLEHVRLLDALSISAEQAVPTVVRCPICRQPQALDVVRSAGQIVYRCRNRRNCGFQGDGLLLYARAAGISLEETALQLLSAGLLPGSDDVLTQIDLYQLDHLEQCRSWLDLWSTAQDQFQQADTNLRVLMQRMHCWEAQETTCDRQWLGGMLGALTGQQLLDHAWEGRQRRAMTWVEAHHLYLVMPMWTAFGQISGFTVWDRSLEWEYLAVNHDGQEVGVGLLENYLPAADHLYLCESPVQALQLTDLGMRCGRPFPVIYVDRRSTAHRQLMKRGQTLLLSCDSLDHYRLALQEADCRVVRPQHLARTYHAAPDARQAELQELSEPAHQALANYLCGLDNIRIQVAAQQLRMSPVDGARVLSCLPESRRQQVKALLDHRMDRQSVKFGQDEITCTADGWVSSRRGQILNCVFFVDRLVYDPDNRQGTAEGVILKGDRQIRFSSPLRDLQSRPLDWLSNQLLSACCGMPVILPGWANKLLNISLLFRDPQVVHSSSQIGWSENHQRLVLPRLIIEDGFQQTNPQPASQTLPGYPLEMQGRDLSVDEAQNLAFDDQAGACFWALFCGVCINLHAPLHGRGTFGIGLIEPQQTLLGQLAEQAREELGLPTVDFSTASQRRLEELKRREQQSPLPYYIERHWHKAEGFSRWLQHQADRNCLVELGLPTAVGTSLDGGWLYLACSDRPSESVERLTGCWKRALPLFLSWAHGERLSFGQTKSELPRALLNAVGDWLQQRGADFRQLNARAQKIIRLDPLDRLSSQGARLLSFVLEHAEAGLLRLVRSEETDDYSQGLITDSQGEQVFVSHQQLQLLFEECGLRTPPAREISEALEQSQILRGRSYGGVRGYVLDQSQYNFLWALRRAGG